MVPIGDDTDKAQIAYNLALHGAELIGYTGVYNQMSTEDLVVDVLKNYLREEPRFVDALAPVITSGSCNFAILHKKAVDANIAHVVHWLLLELQEAFKATRMTSHSAKVEQGLPLFTQYTQPLEEVLRHESRFRRNNVNTFASAAARRCGVPVVYDQPSLQDTVSLYCHGN